MNISSNIYYYIAKFVIVLFFAFLSINIYFTNVIQLCWRIVNKLYDLIIVMLSTICSLLEFIEMAEWVLCGYMIYII